MIGKAWVVFGSGAQACRIAWGDLEFFDVSGFM
jgi:hypothetical protein